MPLRFANPLHDSNFTHCTEAGYEHRCRCEPCTRAKASAEKARAVRRALLGAPSWLDVLPLVLAPENLAALRAAVPDLTDAELALTVASSPEVIRRALNGEPGHERVLYALATVSPADVYSATDTVPEAEVALAVGQLAALGYPVAWQEARTRVHLAASVRTPTVMGRTRRASLRALARLREQTRERVASERHGISASDSAQAAAAARAAGYYPPASYDDDGRLILNAVPDSPHDRADQRAAVRLRVAAALADNPPRDDEKSADVERRTGATPFVLEKVAPVVARLLASSDPALREIVAAWQAGELAPLLAALRLGLYRITDKGLPRDHPDYVAFRDEQAPHHLAA